jgi:hypothetical protein
MSLRAARCRLPIRRRGAKAEGSTLHGGHRGTHSKNHFSRADLDHLPGDEDSLVFVNPQSEPTAAAGVFALSNAESGRQRTPGGDEPAAEVRTCGARPWIFDDRAVLQEKASSAESVGEPVGLG